MKWQLAIEPEVEVDRQEQKHKRQEARDKRQERTLRGKQGSQQAKCCNRFWMSGRPQREPCLWLGRANVDKCTGVRSLV